MLLPSYDPVPNDPDAFLARFPSGASARVRRSRARAYPGLAGAAPSTAGLYRAASHALPQSGSMLDIGAGAGAGAGALVSPTRRVTGLEPSDEALEFARSLVPAVELVRDASELKPGVRFDGITVIDVLGFAQTPEALLVLARERLADEGVLVVAESRSALEAELVPPARRAFSIEELQAMLLRAGLRPATTLTAPVDFVGVTAQRDPNARVRELLARAGAPNTGDVEDAVESAGALLEAVGDPVAARELLLAYGELHMERGDPDSAAAAYVGAMRIAPECARGLLGLARVAERLHRLRDAGRLYERATQLAPHSALVWSALGAFRAKQGDDAAAVTALRNALRLTPTDETVVRALAQLEGGAGHADAAREHLRAYEPVPAAR